MTRKFHKSLNKTKKLPLWLKKIITGRVNQISIFNECLKRSEKKSAIKNIHINLKANADQQDYLKNEIEKLSNQRKDIMDGHQSLTAPIKKQQTDKKPVSKIIWVLGLVLLLIVGWTFYFIFII
jgi:septal ring factor EnvC (AmiA/AmiB activator)